jgi:hypothetical protein
LFKVSEYNLMDVVIELVTQYIITLSKRSV